MERDGDFLMVTPSKGFTMSGITRAEVISVVAVSLNILTLVFGAGVMWADIQDQERRLAAVEASNTSLVQRVERIDANVTFLADLAREERQRR